MLYIYSLRYSSLHVHNHLLFSSVEENARFLPSSRPSSPLGAAELEPVIQPGATRSHRDIGEPLFIDSLQLDHALWNSLFGAKRNRATLCTEFQLQW